MTKLVDPGFAFWPKSQQYRHIIPGNPNKIVGNCNLYDVSSSTLIPSEQEALVAILNSTIVGLFKTFYGRFAGTEGNLKTEVVDVNLLEVPDPRGVSNDITATLRHALERMCAREVGHLVEEQLMDCHSPERARRLATGPIELSAELRRSDRRELDDAVLELLGVESSDERSVLLDRLYDATARHFREIRVVEIEKMEQRAKSANRRFTVQDLAADIWDAAELEDATPLAEWLAAQPESDSLVSIPEERPVALSTDIMFSPNLVYFGKNRRSFVDCTSRGQAELVEQAAKLGVTGDVRVPDDLDGGFKVLDRMRRRIDAARLRFQELTESRTGDERIREQMMELLLRWYATGRVAADGSRRESTEEPTPNN